MRRSCATGFGGGAGSAGLAAAAGGGAGAGAGVRAGGRAGGRAGVFGAVGAGFGTVCAPRGDANVAITSALCSNPTRRRQRNLERAM